VLELIIILTKENRINNVFKPVCSLEHTGFVIYIMFKLYIVTLSSKWVDI